MPCARKIFQECCHLKGETVIQRLSLFLLAVVAVVSLSLVAVEYVKYLVAQARPYVPGAS